MSETAANGEGETNAASGGTKRRLDSTSNDSPVKVARRSSASVSEVEDVDDEIARMKRQMEEAEQEVSLLQQRKVEIDSMSTSITSPSTGGAGAPQTDAEKQEIDERSVYVGNVDYSATAPELEQHFNSCGVVKRVTILQDKFTGMPKGYAYVEFEDAGAVETALALNESTFKGRQIKVEQKRTNLYGISSTDRPPRGRGRGRFMRGGRRPFRRGFRRPSYY